MNSRFDTSKYTKKQLQDTYKLYFVTSGVIDFDGYPVFNLDEKPDPIGELEKKYSEQKTTLENLDIVDLEYWKNIKKLKIEELTSYYNFQKTAFFAYSNPSLLAKTVYDSKAEIYVDALVSGDSLKMITTWKKLIEEQKAKNSSPEYLEKKFQSRLNSPQCLDYAKMELFSFGWGNNVSKSCKECEILNRTDLLFEEYKKLFVSSTEECDEP